MAGHFVISLDFELLWGVRDVADKDSYGRNILGVRQAIPAMLDEFEKFGVRATWATVGMLLCESKDEILARAPMERPTYRNPALSNYSYLDEVGANERADPYYFGASLARRILSCPGQELATHTFSHYYCLEPGQTHLQFEADLQAAVAMFAGMGVECRSIVFPRNQYSRNSLEICVRHDITHYRGSRQTWMYGVSDGAGQTPLRRLARLADAYVDFSWIDALFEKRALAEGGDLPRPSDVAGQRFLRPWARRLAVLDGLRLRRITREMTEAAVNGEHYHLWWHPHNFGVNLDENISFLRAVLRHFAQLKDAHGMTNLTMCEIDT
ncbi:polysaccharide deacetylase family protein [Methylocystis sp.]|uniref:polysaccharide deacetylase family protein n=1 Tax=Methylocystis sp. TaxID=1911079 RepID=UPI003DA24EDB